MPHFPRLSFPLALAALSTALAVTPETTSAPARHLRVDPVHGDDARDGVTGPVKTLRRAVRLAAPGDTVHLAPATYYETLDLSLKEGEPGRPITVEGHGAILDGSEPVRATDWESLGNGLYRRIKLLPMNPAILGRWFFLWDGKMNHMGRTSKGPSAPLKPPGDLQPGEWTYETSEDAFYIRLAPGQNLDAANLRYPARSNGVAFSGHGRHLVVRHLTATHVWNDGFNIHGSQRHLRFEKITALECGDDGFSAHKDAECTIDGFTSIGNSTGLCDVNESITHYRNVYIRDCLGHDLFFIGLEHSLENAYIESSAARAFSFDGGRLPEGKSARIRLKNVHLSRTGGGVQEVRVGARGLFEAEACTFRNLNFTITPGASMSLRQCLVTGTPPPAILIWNNVTWQGAGNWYDLSSLRVGNTFITPAAFGDFQKLVASETGSTWAPASPTPRAGVGADLPGLEKLKR